jgi:hypothetical protein
MNACREAFDLHNPACRCNARYRVRRVRTWREFVEMLWLIWSDTRDNVCPPRT